MIGFWELLLPQGTLKIKIQSELAACYGVIRIVNAIYEEHEIVPEMVEIRCLNIEALQCSVDLEYFITPNHSHFNITTGIHIQLKPSLIKGKV